MANYVTECLQPPSRSYLLYCSIQELKKLFTFKTKEFDCKLENYNDTLIISIISKKGDYIGRGEIVPLGDKFTKLSIKAGFDKHMKDFLIRYAKGTTRLNSIMYKIKVVRDQMNKPSPIGSKFLS